MTVLETSTNGNGQLSLRERVRQVRDEHGGNISGAEIGRLIGEPATTVNYHLRALVADGDKTAVSVVVADGRREAPPPTRSNKSRGKKMDPEPEPVERGLVDWAIIAIVTAVAAIWSYSHIVDLAIDAGHGWRSYLLPLAIDGLLVAGVRAVGRDRRYPIAWIAIMVGVVGTVAGNVLAVRPELANMADVAAVSAAFPAIALPTIVHLVRR